MKVKICDDAVKLGQEAAAAAATVIRQAIARKGGARILLSTGASQFETIDALVKQDIDWSKVEMFHLDEYIGLPASHPASFRRYLRERFADRVKLRRAHFVDGEGDVPRKIATLTREIREEPIDLGLIGIGENAHIAFNDPPADFATREAYIIVDLDDRCKRQQVGEGWFAKVGDVPQQAISMTVYQIMQCGAIISCVPHKVKAQAIKATLESDISNEVPATILKSHRDWTLFLDKEAASLVRDLSAATR